ncbi:MAG: hypothetical protein LUO93_05345, partial [Methanomicrobiales archaeon]|nr:hypothetical protein [Methanomicrobiales archaeon]
MHGALTELISRQWRSMIVERMTVDSVGACLRDVPLDGDVVAFFLTSEMHDLPTFASWCIELAGRLDRPLLLAVASDRREADLFTAGAPGMPYRVICIEGLSPATLRLAMNEALAERVRQALMLNRSLRRSMSEAAEQPAYTPVGDDWAPTMVLSRTPDGLAVSVPRETTVADTP